jgi:hypothetical protein
MGKVGTAIADLAVSGATYAHTRLGKPGARIKRAFENLEKAGVEPNKINWNPQGGVGTYPSGNPPPTGGGNAPSGKTPIYPSPAGLLNAPPKSLPLPPQIQAMQSAMQTGNPRGFLEQSIKSTMDGMYPLRNAMNGGEPPVRPVAKPVEPTELTVSQPEAVPESPEESIPTIAQPSAVTNPSEAVSASAKQPWEMTQSQYLSENYSGDVNDANHPDNNFIANSKMAHKFQVEKALSEGKPVPPEVLAEYPDLQKSKPFESSAEKPKKRRVGGK